MGVWGVWSDKPPPWNTTLEKQAREKPGLTVGGHRGRVLYSGVGAEASDAGGLLPCPHTHARAHARTDTHTHTPAWPNP